MAAAVALARWSLFLWDFAGAHDRVLYTFVSLNVAAGIVYLIAVAAVYRARLGWVGIAGVLLIGLLLRLVLLPSSLVLETDAFRYFWDGALAARGVSPYLHTPADGHAAMAGHRGDHRVSAAAREAGPRLELVNHPDVQTVYPPVAQAAFALAYRVDPWTATSWRMVLLACDLATVALLLALLRRARLPAAWVAIYWWNPLLVKEFYSGGHMDAVVLPFVTGGLLLAVHKRVVGAAACIAAAVAVKFWPAILLPFVLRRSPGGLRTAGVALGTFVLTTVILLSPMLWAGRGGFAGTVTYSQSWQNNDGLFRINVLFWQYALPLVGVPAWHAQLTARGTAVVALGAWVLFLTRPPMSGPVDLCERSLLAVSGLFLLSPTQFPWYYTWLLPLLALRPRWSLLIYTALLPLYHLHYRQPAWVWVEHVPVLVLLAVEWLLRFRSSSSPSPLGGFHL